MEFGHAMLREFSIRGLGGQWLKEMVRLQGSTSCFYITRGDFIKQEYLYLGRAKKSADRETDQREIQPDRLLRLFIKSDQGSSIVYLLKNRHQR
jgi:hypothetical protein